MKYLLIISHCILNTASKVAMDEGELKEEYEKRDRLIRCVMENNIQLLQLPCPEFIIYGSRRWGHVKEQFMHPHYYEECRKMLYPVLQQIEEYVRYPEEYQVAGIVSVEGSPSCGYHMTCSGNWGGELSGDAGAIKEMQNTCKTVNGPGVFMEILEKELAARAMTFPIMSMEEAVQKLSGIKRNERTED